jgi:hypothetical protein
VRRWIAGLFVVAAVVVVATLALRRPFPSDREPDGAYMRVAQAISDDKPEAAFAYLETDAQWACFTIRDMRKRAAERVRASYPEAERGELLKAYEAEASAVDGADVFAIFARRRGWVGRLRRDLSGVARVEIEGERATVVTARGTRYPFRKRDNGIWGMTMFTADLVGEAERASRDWALVRAAAEDYERAKTRADPDRQAL